MMMMMMLMLMIVTGAMVCALATRQQERCVWGRRGTTAKSEEVKGCCRCLKTIAAC